MRKSSTHHAEALVNPKDLGQKKASDFGYPMDSENIKLKIGPQSLLDQLFSKRDLNS
jgi:hypothetical protein